MRTAEDTGKQIHHHTGWLIPLAVFAVTAALSAVFLLYYLAPRPRGFTEELPSLTTNTSPVRLSVHHLALAIPANYFEYESTRKGGEEKDVALVALLPDFRGYTRAEARNFTGNDPNSPVIYLLLHEDPHNLSEAERFKRIYLNYVSARAGTAGPFGFTRYSFRPDSGYRGEDLFVAHTARDTVLFRCVRFSPDVPSPSCMRDEIVAPGVALSYRFKRAHLAHWQAISKGARALVQSFIRRAQ
jgi:hypothetical protein